MRQWSLPWPLRGENRLNRFSAINGRAALVECLADFLVGFGAVEVHHVEDLRWPRRRCFHFQPAGFDPSRITAEAARLTRLRRCLP